MWPHCPGMAMFFHRGAATVQFSTTTSASLSTKSWSCGATLPKSQVSSGVQMASCLQVVVTTTLSTAGSGSGFFHANSSSRVGTSVLNEVQRVVPKWTKRNHTAAVKVRVL